MIGCVLWLRDLGDVALVPGLSPLQFATYDGQAECAVASARVPHLVWVHVLASRDGTTGTNSITANTGAPASPTPRHVVNSRSSCG